jgi:hypothetical protein
MRKLLAKGLVIIIEASLFMLAELITKRREGNGLHRDRWSRTAPSLRGAGHSGNSWLVRSHRRRRSIS